jgi:SAM-dependent methyltransferase
LQVFRDWQTTVRLQFLFAAQQCGLLSALRQPRTKAELSAELKVERPDVLDALLDLGIAVGELGCKAERYRLKGHRALALAEPRGDPLAAVIEACLTYYNRIYQHAAERLRGGLDDDSLAEIGEVVARFSALAEPMVRNIIAAQVPREGTFHTLDVGCGSGTYLRTVASLNPQSTGVGLENDETVAAGARQNLNAWGIVDRYRIVCGDILSSDTKLEGMFQLITLLNVVYYFTDEQRPALFRAIRKRLDAKGRFVLVNNMYSPRMDVSAANLNMAVTSMQGCTPLPKRERLFEQLREAGFQTIEAKRLASQASFWALIAKL